MTHYRVVAADLVSGTIREEIPLGQFTYEHVLNGPGGLDASIGHRHPKAARTVLDPGRTAIYVERDGLLVWGGWLVYVRRDEGSRYLTLRCEGFVGYLHRRHMRETRVYTQTDQLTVARDLLRYAQGSGSTSYGPTSGNSAGSIGIQTPSGSSGVLRDRTYHGYERQNIGELLDQLAAVQGGFDFAVDVEWQNGLPAKVLRLGWPTRGRPTGLVFGLGQSSPGNATDYSWSVDVSRTASLVDAIGAGEEAAMLIATASDPNLWQVYPVLESMVSRRNVSRLSTLTGHANAQLRARRLPTTIPTLTVRADRPDVGSYTTGDTVRVVIDDGPVQVDALHRIESYRVSVGEDDAEQVSVTFIDPSATDDG